MGALPRGSHGVFPRGKRATKTWVSPMKLRRTLICLAAVTTVIYVANAIRRSSPIPTPEITETSRPTKVNRDVSGSGKTRADVLRMTPAEWQARFEKKSPPISPATRDDILHLSGELQEALASGTDPRSEEARVYVDAIRELLDYRE